MMAERILIIDDDVETLRLVGLMLERQGYQISAADNGERAINKARSDKPSLILLDVMMPDMSGYDVAKILRGDKTTSNIPIIMFTAKSQVDDKVEGLEAGADAYLTKPTQPRELIAQVKALLARSKAVPAPTTAPQTAPAVPIKGFMLGVLAAKGGLGVSSLVTNLGVTIRKLTGEPVVIADFHPGSGDIGLSLGYNSANGVSNLLKKDANTISGADIKNEISAHHSGIHVLTTPQRPRDAIFATRIHQYRSIARQLPDLAKYVLLDLGSALPPMTQSILKYCDKFLIAIEPTPPGVHQTRALLEDLAALGVGAGRIELVLVNRQRTNLQLNWADVQDSVGHTISTVITPAPELAYKAREISSPMVVQQPSSLTAEQFTKLAASILEQ
jgi:CheY-like chemotaxis protein/MinD-like ATPase involved in chromosome partitioning or flagellar assembly